MILQQSIIFIRHISHTSIDLTKTQYFAATFIEGLMHLNDLMLVIFFFC